MQCTRQSQTPAGFEDKSVAKAHQWHGRNENLVPDTAAAGAKV